MYKLFIIRFNLLYNKGNRRASEGTAVKHASTTTSTAFAYPPYDELPERLLFAREIVAFVNRVHEPLSDRVRRGKVFTVPMATNYVKGGLTPPAIGRRYNREHLALVLFAATAKLCFSAEEVHWLAGQLFEGRDVRGAHDAIARALNDALARKPVSGREGAVALAFQARIQALGDE